FAQFRAAGFEDFANSKPAADLDNLAAGNQHFGFRSDEVANDQDQRRRAIVHDRRGFSLAKDGQRSLEVGAASAAVSSLQIKFYVIISRRDIPKDFSRTLGKRRADEVRVNDHSRAVDHWLNPTGAKCFNCSANQFDNCGQLRDFLTAADLFELTT